MGSLQIGVVRSFYYLLLIFSILFILPSPQQKQRIHVRVELVGFVVFQLLLLRFALKAGFLDNHRPLGISANQCRSRQIMRIVAVPDQFYRSRPILALSGSINTIHIMLMGFSSVKSTYHLLSTLGLERFERSCAILYDLGRS